MIYDVILSKIRKTDERSVSHDKRRKLQSKKKSVWEQSITGCFPEFVFQISVAQVLVGLLKQFMNIFDFPTWACSAGFNNNNNSFHLFYFKLQL